MSLGRMNKREAETLVEGVLTGSYSEAELRKLVVNIFPDMEPKTDRWTGAYVPEAFRSGVAQYSRVGKVEDPEGYTVDILAVKLKNAGTLERARTLQRNFVARYLNGGRGGVLRDAALVAFYADDAADWRFSLVRMDYTLDPEKNKVRKELTPARRYSFLVGGDEKTHTAKRQLATLLQGGSVTLGDLERAFNIESVTKEFFEQYKGLFIGLKEELDDLEHQDPCIRQEFTAKHIDTATFAKRLLGQIVFLYFLQKKGWLGVEKDKAWGSGPKNFLSQLFEATSLTKNFFDEVLEPLFYKALAEKNEDDVFADLDRKIPFLNGGLFEPVGGYDWEETRINLKNETFAQIFNTFDLYNFTVREDEPLDKEVAVDPEMLGKVFENLLEVKDRKSKGAFYTPREIVHYMCQESLINYLDTAVNTATRPLLTPAPSQAELFGKPKTWQAPLTHEVYEERVSRADLAEFIRLGDAAQEHDAATAARVRETDAYSFKVPGSVRQHADALDAALASIKICDPAIGSGAFPVGMMNEIVRARGALNPYLGTENRAAYDFKRHAIQESIYGVDIEESAVDIAKLRLWLSLIVDEDDFGTIKPLPNLEYKIVIGNSLLGVEETLFNNKAFETLARLQHDYIGETRPGQKRSLKGRIDALIGELTNDSERFDFKIYFSEVFMQKGGFDVVIGNPPYISFGLRNVGKLSKLDSDYYRTRFSNSAEYKMSVYAIFIQLGIELTCRGGVTSYIVPDSFLLGRYFSKIRRYILNKTKIDEIVLATGRVFEGATIGTSVIFRFLKDELKDYLQDTSVRLSTNINQFDKREFVEARYSQSYFSSLPYDRFRLFFDQKDKKLVDKLEDEKSNLLSDMALISSGLIGKGGKDSIVASEKINSLWSEGLHSGGEIRRYSVQHKGGYIAFDKSKLKSGYQNARYDEPKLLGRQTGDRLIWAYDNKHLLCLNNVHVLNSRDSRYSLKYLLGIVNSQLLSHYYNLISLELGRALAQTDIETLEKLPIRTINFSDPSDKQKHDAVVGLVETMLSLHEQKAATLEPSERAHLEREIAAADAQIDRLVYGLYELTEEEIKIVEGGA